MMFDVTLHPSARHCGAFTAAVAIGQMVGWARWKERGSLVLIALFWIAVAAVFGCCEGAPRCFFNDPKKHINFCLSLIHISEPTRPRLI
eukprot:3735087-Amphidinium_carterae.1